MGDEFRRDASGSGESTSGGWDPEVDRRFLEALLHQHFHVSADEDRRRVESAIRRLQSESGRGGEGRRLVIGPQIRVFVLAALAVLAVILAPVLLSESASAAVSRSLRSMARAMDFHYEVEIEARVGPTIRGELWVHGAEQVAFRFDRLGRDLWLGEGQDSAWVVPALPLAPVLVSERGALLDKLLEGDELVLPFLRVTAVLTKLEEDGFEIEFGPGRKTIEARRADRESNQWMSQVTLQVADDGVVRELVASSSGTVRGPRRVTLRWIDSRPKLASFYEHRSHHDGRRVFDRR